MENSENMRSGVRHGSRRRMYLRMVTSSLVRRASRLIIAVLAIAIGATILSGLVTIYYDIPRQLGREFRSYGANLIILPKGDARITREELLRVRDVLGPDRIGAPVFRRRLFRRG